jgi:uncharacterized protein YegL
MGFFDRLFGKKKEESPSFKLEPFSYPHSSEIEIFDLKKTNEKITISLAKKNVSNVVAEVKLVLDCSGSMEGLYGDGTVQQTIHRLAPLAFRFDDNGTMETMLFNTKLKEMPDITIENYFNYYDKNLRNVVSGGTNYSNAISKITNEAKRGDYTFPVFVIFITDGDNGDKEETKKALIEASNYDIYFQFVGIGYDNLSFLKSLDNLRGRKFDNAGFIEIKDLSRISDEDLYEQLLDEFVDNCKNGVLKSAKVEIIDLSK